MVFDTVTKRGEVLASLLALVCCACTGGGNVAGAADTGASGACMGTSITASETNNYSFWSSLTFPPVKVAPRSDLQFDWSGVTADFINHAVDPKKDLNTILLLEWDLSLADLQTKLNADELASRDLTIVPPLSYTPDGNTTSARMLEFELNGNPIGGELVSVDHVLSYFDPETYSPSTHTFTLMATTGQSLGQGTRMVQSFMVDPDSTNTSVTMTQDSTRLDFQADLTKLTPTSIPAGQAHIKLDWGKMKTNALGGDFSTTRITSAFIGHYGETTAELSGEKFLDIDLIASVLYRKDVDVGTSADFSAFADASGNQFSGVDDSGTWLLGLQCGDCRNPAPWYLTVLKPCD
jgi:hypothetical protein